MSIAHIFHMSRNDSIKDFVPLSRIKTVGDKEVYKDTDYLIGYTFDEFKNKYPTIDATKIFFCNGLHKTYYYDEVNYVLFSLPLYGKAVHMATDKPFDEFTNWLISEYISNLQNREYSIPILALNDRMRMEYFNILAENNMLDGLFKLFMQVYTTSDYGCEAISHENMIKLFNSRSQEEKIKMNQEKNNALKRYPDTLTVYRGEASKSTSHHDSWSWTLDINTANFFATRFGRDDSKIVKGTVSKDCVDTYFREESECIINPKNVADIEITELYGQSWLATKMNPYIMKLYHKYRDILIKKYENSHEANSHDQVHSARVLCLALLLGSLHKLNHAEMTNLATAIVYHDLGRVDDSEDDLHGKRGAEIFMKTRAASSINKKLVAFLVECHCLDDYVGNEIIQTDFNDDERVHLLFNIIKDADALDRVRFGKYGLDMSYLRLSESSKMTLVARLFFDEVRL